MSQYYPGSAVHLTANFKVSNLDTNPGSITLKVKGPAGTIETFTYVESQVLMDSTGCYHYDYTVTAAGIYHYRFEGTSPAEGAEEATFDVLEGDFAS